MCVTLLHFEEYHAMVVSVVVHISHLVRHGSSLSLGARISIFNIMKASPQGEHFLTTSGQILSLASGVCGVFSKYKTAISCTEVYYF